MRPGNTVAPPAARTDASGAVTFGPIAAMSASHEDRYAGARGSSRPVDQPRILDQQGVSVRIGGQKKALAINPMSEATRTG